MVPVSAGFFIFIHICISLAGVLIHVNMHPIDKSLYYLWATPVCLFSMVVIPVLYYRPSTVSWGFLLNAGAILIGTVGMLYYSLLNLARPVTLDSLLVKSALPYTLILWTKLPVSILILNKIKPLKTERSQR